MGLIGALIGSYLVLVALMAGSFINLAADRIPRGESIVRPRSHCRACGRRLNFIDLLPVAGYIWRGGRCATCGAPIGFGAPVVEATCGLLVAVPLIWLGLWPGAAVGLVLVAGLGASLVVYRLRSRALGEAGL